MKKEKVLYKNILLKLSGEALGNKEGVGFDPKIVASIAQQVQSIQKLGVNISIVIGGGNIFRGGKNLKTEIAKVQGDFIGMEATNVNALVLQEMLHTHNIKAIALSALGETKAIESYIISKALCYFSGGYVVLCAGGTGNPFFTTDSAALLRALELGCDVVLKATKVDGIYSDDPMKNKKAKKYTTLSYQQALKENLQVMDQTAFALAKEYKLPIVVFNMQEKDAIVKIVKGEKIGTLVS